MSEASSAPRALEQRTRRLAAIVLGANVLTLGLAWSLTSGPPAEAVEHVLLWCGIG